MSDASKTDEWRLLSQGLEVVLGRISDLFRRTRLPLVASNIIYIIHTTRKYQKHLYNKKPTSCWHMPVYTQIDPSLLDTPK